jgi:nickel/cobalt transporter (NicO) family protein
VLVVVDSVLFSVIVFGLLHGISPSHGWPVALLYSMRSKRSFLSGFTSSAIIAGAHFGSSIIVVVAYTFALTFIQIPQIYLRFAAAIALGILAYMFWKEKGGDLIKSQHGHLHNDIDQIDHEHIHWHKGVEYHSHMHIHQKREQPSLKAIISFAFVLGFAHEEEFVILAFAAGGGGDPIILMITYAISVTAALIGITMICLKLFTQFQYKIIHYSKYLPKITAILIAFMAVGFATGLI